MDMDGSPENRLRKTRRRIKAKLSNFFVPVNAAQSQNAVKSLGAKNLRKRMVDSEAWLNGR
jgi:hypothetical protein